MFFRSRAPHWTSGRKFWPDNSQVAGQQFVYSYDDIGNRKQVRTGGDAGGRGRWVGEYSANLLNQYSVRETLSRRMSDSRLGGLIMVDFGTHRSD